MSDPTEANSPSQTLRAVLGVRGLITDGLLKGGDRIAEPLVVERFGVSRTPARAALAQLKEEGLVQLLPSGGYVTSTFTERDVFDAIELRGTLEGLAARFAAERGPPPSILTAMQQCVAELDIAVAAFAETYDPDHYVRLNDRFHDLLIKAGQSPMVERSLQRVLSLPFAAPNAFVRSSRSEFPDAVRIMVAAQAQHRSIVEAINDREGKRAEALACEHSRSAWNYLRIALVSGSLRFPGHSLIRRVG
jgi:GntR family transcriptional regulator, vanillate catabolism transcriptional regulator